MLNIGRAWFFLHSFKNSYLLWNFPTYFCNMIVKFQFVIYCYAKHLKFFSHWDTGIFTLEIKCDIRFSHHDGLILRIIPFQTVLIVPFIDKLEVRVYSTLNFSIVIMSKENLRVVCIAREFTSFHDEQEIVDENIKYQRPEDWSLGNPSGNIIPARIFSSYFHSLLAVREIILNDISSFSSAPYSLNFLTMRSCGRESKAFDKSIETRPIIFRLSSSFRHSSSNI